LAPAPSNTWLSGVVGAAGDAWFSRRTDLCHWTVDAGFAPVTLTGPFVGISSWSGIAEGDDGGLWLTSSEVYGVFDLTGAMLQVAPVTELRRVGNTVYAWGEVVGEGELWAFKDSTWKRVVGTAMWDLWGEREGEAWALERAKVDGAPVLSHLLADGGIERFVGSQYFPPDLTGINFLYLAGTNGRLMLLGTGDGVGKALELRLRP
jgi:hypothetical protein